MHLRRFLFIGILLSCFGRAFGVAYVVTSNADSGPGSLRNTIILAQMAGDAVSKTITFNLPDQSEAGRTITVENLLPALPSNLTIDASTQSGAGFGISDAKVKIVVDPAGSSIYETGFYIGNKQNVTIEGFYFDNAFTNKTDPLNMLYGIYVVNSSNVQIGAPGKGNVIFGFTWSVKAEKSTNLTLKDNFCDVDIDGASLAQNLAAYYGIGITDSYSAINIGGATAAEGNLVAEPVEIAQSVSLPATTINIQYNKLNTDFNVTKTLGIASYIDISEPASGGSNVVNVDDNVISGYISEENITGTATFLRNYINVDRTQKITLAYNANVGGIIIKNSTGQVVIGSATNTADGNVIAYCKPFDFEHTGKVSFNRNSIFCPNNLYPVYQSSNYTQIPTVTVTDNEQTGLVGTAPPNSTVELFYSDLCHVCSPQTFFASVQADAKGIWVYTGVLDVAVIASATLNGSTSEFTNSIVIDISKMDMVHPTCQTGHGSIRGIVVNHATGYTWTDANNTPISHELDLPSEPPGIYTLTAYSEGCSSSMQFNLSQAPPTVYPDYPVAIQKSCPNLPSGSITVTADELVKDNGFVWVDSVGNTLGSNQNVARSLTPGHYTLYLTDQGGCMQKYKVYNVGTLLTMTANTDNMHVAPDQCGHGNGSISGVRIDNAQPPLTYGWVNAAGKTVSSQLDASNLTAGDYILIVGDDSHCGPLTFNVTVPDASLYVPTPTVSNVRVCTTGPTFINVTGADSSSTYNLYKNANDTQPMAQSVGGLFKVNVTGNSGFYISRLNGTCESSRAELDVTISLAYVDIANAFTPNGDGINDYWKINNIEQYPLATVQVFTRDGQRVFESAKGYPVPFDGTYHGKKLPVGVYYYLIDLHTSCSLISGSLTILR